MILNLILYDLLKPDAGHPQRVAEREPEEHR